MDINIERKDLKHMTSLELFKQGIGFLIIYGLVLIVIPYYLYRNSSFAIFLTYFANVDIIANNLVISYPSYFSHIYNIKPSSVFDYFSYNIITLVALSGIFMYGLDHKNNTTLSDVNILFSMVIMSIITWTLPTNLLPYLFNKFKEHFNISSHDYDLIISFVFSTFFILFEYLFISYSLHYLKKLEKGGIWSSLRF